MSVAVTGRREALLRELKFRKAFRHDGTPEGAVAAFAFFCKTFAKIQKAEHEIPFVLRDAQLETAKALCARENIIVLKARQIGFSTLFANYALWKALTTPSYSVLFLSSKQEEAVYLLAKAKFTYARLPRWVRDKLPASVSNHQQKMGFKNHASITSLPSRKDAARGRTTSLLIADEFASLQDQDEAWAAMLPATDVGGQAVVLSTAKGSGDLFETLWNKATTGAMNWKPLFWSWRTAFDDEWYENKKRELLPWQLAQEHPSNAEEAFVRSGNAVFDLDMLRAMVPVDPMYGELTYLEPRSGRFHPVQGGPLRIWETPEQEVKYVIGVDIAEGLEHGDRSVAVVLRADTFETAAIYTCREAPWEFARSVAELGWFYNTALIGPERNNHGHAFIRALVELEYFPIFRHRRTSGRRPKETEELGWLTIPKTKAYMISEFDKWMKEPDNNIPDVVTVAELKTYVRDENGRMSGSPFDDHVMAFGIAVEMLNHAHLAEYKPQQRKLERWTWGWFEQRYGKDENSGRKIGH